MALTKLEQKGSSVFHICRRFESDQVTRWQRERVRGGGNERKERGRGKERERERENFFKCFSTREGKGGLFIVTKRTHGDRGNATKG